MPWPDCRTRNVRAGRRGLRRTEKRALNLPFVPQRWNRAGQSRADRTDAIVTSQRFQRRRVSRRRHDTIFGCCSFEVDRIRYGAVNEECCQRNFERELSRHNIGPEHIVSNVNFFMYVPVDPHGNAEIRQSLSKPGDHVTLRAEMDVLCVFSNCPEALNDATGDSGPTPVRAIVCERV